MRFEALASSSSGNAYVVSDRDTRILLECGVSIRSLQQLTDFGIKDIKACFVTHEHKDHAKAVKDLISRGIPMYMSCGTAEALEVDGVELIESMEQVNVGSMDVVAFDTFHDAKEPLGFLIKSRVDGDVLAFATDTVNLRYRFPGLTILAIEANFDKAILERCQKMPEKVRHRVANSHMEIDVLCDYLKWLDLSRCREIYLLHLSDATSHEGHFLNKVRRVVPGNITVAACARGAGK